MNEILADFGAQLLPILLNLLIVIIGAAASIVGLKVNQFLADKTKRAIVESAVMFVEQVGKSLGSEEKFDRAKTMVIAALNEKGIKISDTEVQLLIEAAVHNFFAHYNVPEGE